MSQSTFWLAVHWIKIKTIGFCVVLAVSELLFGGWPLHAQENLGTIVGTVTDPSGASVVSADVTAVNEGTAVTLKSQTNSSGLYRFNALPIGQYKVTVSNAGFQTYVQSGISVVSGQTVSVNVKLVVGGQTQVVNVTAAAPILDLTASTEATIQTLQNIENLPLTSDSSTARAAISLVGTFAGVSYNPNESGGSAPYVFARAQVNGVPSGAWNYNIDGVDGGQGSAERGHDNLPPTPDMIQEARLSANNDVSEAFSPGVTLELTEKSGTNQIHGSVFEYLNNAAFDAVSFGYTAKTQDDKNNFGFTLGGPVVIPHLYDGKNRTFFFVDWDFFRYRATNPNSGDTAASGSVATALMRQGNFSELLGPQTGTDALGRPVYQGEIYDPSTTRPGPGGTIVRDPFQVGGILNNMGTAAISPISADLIAQEALPNLPGTANNWAGPSGQNRTDSNKLYLKFDETINPKNHFTFAYETLTPFTLYGETRGINSGYSGNSYISAGPGYLGPLISGSFIDDRDEYRLRFNYTWLARSNLLVNVRGGLTRTPTRLEARFPFSGGLQTYGAQIGLKGTLNPASPYVYIAGYSAMAPGFALTHFYTPEQNLPVDLDVSWTKGKHNFKFGVDFTSIHSNLIDSGLGWGSWNFNTSETGLPGFPVTGSGMSSFMIGAVDNATVGTPNTSEARTGALGFYGQDIWRVTPQLTLTMGLRWDFFKPTTETENRIGGFDPTLLNPEAGNLPGALSVWGVGPGRNGLTRLNNYYPGAISGQLGIAYALGTKTIIRANFGNSYGAGWTKWLNGQNNNLPSPGFSASLTSSSPDNGVTPAFNWNNGFPLAFPQLPVTDPGLENGSSLGFIDRNQNRPVMYENLGFEVGRELPYSISLRASYVGTFAHRMPTAAENLDVLPLSDYALGSLLLQNVNSPAAVAAGITPPYVGFNGSVAQALLPYPQFQGVPVLAAPIGNSAYNAFQLNLQKRLGHGLSFLAAYTFSKTLSNNYNAINGSGTSNIQSPYLFNQARQLDPASRPQSLFLSWTYDLPFGKDRQFASGVNSWLNQVIGGWQVSAIQNYFAGRPLNVRTEETIPYANGSASSAVFPNLNKGVPIVLTSCSNLNPNNPAHSTYLNAKAFSTPAPFTFGNVSTVPGVGGCGYEAEALAITKEFRFTEVRKLRLGFQGTNVFNRHEWVQDDLNLDTNSSAFGQYGGTYPGRIIEFLGRYVF
jgi:hypothetical protein